MPKFLFYAGTAFCLFLALSCAAAALHLLDTNTAVFIAIGTLQTPVTARGPLAIIVGLLAGVSAAAMFLRMAALVAARNLFAAFVALLSAGCALASLVWTLMLQARILFLLRSGAPADGVPLRTLGELHLAGVLALGYFLALTLLALRPYFRVQASRFLSALVFFPLPLVFLILAQELFVGGSPAPLPAASPALTVLFAVLALLFLAIGVHCIRHRYLFLEMTNLRELLDHRIDPTAKGTRSAIGGVAFDA